MKRITYSPKVEAWVKTDYGIIDLSPYVVRGSISRKIDQISSVEIEIRNPGKKFTEHGYFDPITKQNIVGPLLHPMDPIAVQATRLQGRPVQVFAGYLDTTPYLQLFPGTITLSGSCTLKRLQYTYFDPGLPFFNEWLVNHGWESADSYGIVNPTANNDDPRFKDTNKLKDSGFGSLLFATLNEIGNWPEETIYIEQLPNGIVDLVEGLFVDARKAAKEAGTEFTDLLHKIIGTATLTSMTTAASTPSGDPSAGTASIKDAPQELLNFPRKETYTEGELVKLCTAAGFPDPHFAAQTSMCESSGNTKADSHDEGAGIVANDGRHVLACCHGLWQLYLGNSPVDNSVFSPDAKGLANAEDPIISTFYVAEHIKSTGDWTPWDCVTGAR
jgi:hypothetical protein